MNHLTHACGIAILAAVAGAATAGTGSPDVIVGELPSTAFWGVSGTERAYSVATTSCNNGTVNLNWFQNGLDHPVIAQNLYRYRVLPNGVGRFEQIGLSWLKHGFCALQQAECGGCSPVCGGCCSQLGPGCSDPYSATLNGNWSDLGPRSEVNPTTGDYVWPHALASGNVFLRGRIQFDESELQPGDRYFVEGHYIARDDALAGNGFNNASWREVVTDGFMLLMNGPTHREEPALRAWVDLQPTVAMQTVTFNSGAGDPDEIFHVAHAFTDLGGGAWNYEYAVHNLQSDRAGASFSVPIPDGVTVTNAEVHMVNHHSGEPYDLMPWTVTVNPNDVTWAVQDVGANSNALRWGTMFNFRFDADAAPTATTATLGLFKAGTPSDLSITVAGPDGPVDDPCPGDTDGNGVIDVDDVVNVILCFGGNGIDCPEPGLTTDLDDGTQTGTPSGLVDIDDVIWVVLNFGNTCP